MSDKALFTKKHYDFIAMVIHNLLLSESLHPADLHRVATEFADALGDTNKLYKRDLFVKACGVDDGSNYLKSRAHGA